MADDDAPFEFEIFVSDREAQESISQLFADDAEDTSSISVVDVKPKRAFGSFDLPFCVGIALSIPFGIATGIIANWLTERLRKAKESKGVNSTIKIQFYGYTVIIPADKPAMVGPVIKAIEESVNRKKTVAQGRK